MPETPFEAKTQSCLSSCRRNFRSSAGGRHTSRGEGCSLITCGVLTNTGVGDQYDILTTLSLTTVNSGAFKPALTLCREDPSRFGRHFLSPKSAPISQGRLVQQ